jgi:hypothetical protein
MALLGQMKRTGDPLSADRGIFPLLPKILVKPR